MVIADQEDSQGPFNYRKECNVPGAELRKVVSLHACWARARVSLPRSIKGRIQLWFLNGQWILDCQDCFLGRLWLDYVWIISVSCITSASEERRQSSFKNTCLLFSGLSYLGTLVNFDLLSAEATLLRTVKSEQDYQDCQNISENCSRFMHQDCENHSMVVPEFISIRAVNMYWATSDSLLSRHRIDRTDECPLMTDLINRRYSGQV